MSQNTAQASTGAGSPGATDRNGHNVPAQTLSPGAFVSPEAERRWRELQAQRKVAPVERVESLEERAKRWGWRRYAVSDLPRDQKWARKLRAKVERDNARRDPTKYPPRLTLTGGDAVKAGATDEQIAALPELTNEDIAAMSRRAAAEHEAERMQVRDMARKMKATRDRAVTPPQPVSLAALLDQPDDEQTYRIMDLWPAAGRVLLAAPYKAGKSTLVSNIIRTLVDGGPFLDNFDVAPVRKVALIDTELDTRMLRRWLRDQGIRNTGAVSVVPLRGAVSAFDILDPAARSDWARKLAGADVVILDCLRPVLDSLGLSEDKDAGRVLVAFDALLSEIGASEGMVVTHMGHQKTRDPQGERARGDSRLLDWPDALWKIVRGDDADDGTARSYFSALGRDVDMPEGLLTYDTATRHLNYTGGSRKESTALTAIPELMALVRLEPGTLSKNASEARLIDEHGTPQKVARAAIGKAIRDGLVITARGPRNALLLSPAPGDPFDLPGPSPQPERVN